MNVIPPINITDAMLTSSSVSEPSGTEVVWSAATAYTAEQLVILTSTHRKYKCLLGNTNFNPATNSSGLTPKWLDIGPTNKWAMFDLLRNSATTATDSITVTLTPGTRCDSVAVLASTCSSILVEVIIGAEIVYTNTIFTETDYTEWYDYFFNELDFYPSIVLFDLPPFTGASIRVTLLRAGGEVTCGGLVVGKYVNIGDVQVSPNTGALNFSTVDRDIFGSTNLIPRRNVPKTNQTLFLSASSVNSVRKLRDKLNAVPAVWSGLNSEFSNDYFESLLILGYYRNFSITLDNPVNATVTLELEEI